MKNVESNDRIVRPHELAEMLGVSVSTIFRWRKEQTLPSPLDISPGRIVGWRMSTISNWIAEKEGE